MRTRQQKIMYPIALSRIQGGAIRLFSIVLSIALPFSAGAQIDNPIGCDLLDACIVIAVKYVLGLVAVVAVGFIVYGGFLYITAAGNDDQIRQGKQAVVGAIVGIVVIGLAYAIVEFVFQALGGAGGPPQANQ